MKKYKSTITGDAKKGFIVTNTHNPSKQPKHPKPHDGWGHKKKTGDERHYVTSKNVEQKLVANFQNLRLF